MMNELDKAHRDYEMRRNEVLTKLKVMCDDKDTKRVYKRWLRQIEEFTKEREI